MTDYTKQTMCLLKYNISQSVTLRETSSPISILWKQFSPQKSGKCKCGRGYITQTLLTIVNELLFDPVGQCVANEQYIAQLKETFATSVPSQIAAFFGEPIQVRHPVFDYDKRCS